MDLFLFVESIFIANFNMSFESIWKSSVKYSQMNSNLMVNLANLNSSLNK